MMAASSLMTTGEAVFLRLLSGDASQGQVLLLRSGMQLALVCGACAARAGGLLAMLRTQRIGGHALRGTLAAFSWWAYFMSFKLLPLALATTLTFSSQLFVLMLVWPMLGERVTRPQLISTLVGFLGVLVAARFWNPMALGWGVGLGLFAAFTGAVMIMITRSLAVTERTDTILFYMALAVFASAVPQAAWDWRPLPVSTWLLLLAMAVCGTMGAWLMVGAYRHATPSALAPYVYARLLFAAALGYAVFGDGVAVSTMVGAFLIVASQLVVVWAAARRQTPTPAR